MSPTRTRDGSIFPARLRIVLWMVLTTAVGLTAMVVSVRSTLLADVSRTANAEITQEVAELQRFADVGLDPATSKPFDSPGRLVEVYVGRQQVADHEALIIYTHSIARAEALWGAQVSGFELTSTNPLFVELLNSPTGVAPYGAGEIRWARVDLQPDDPDRHTSVIITTFTEQNVIEVNRTAALMGGIGAGVLILTGIIGMGVAGSVLRPLRDLRRATTNLTEHDLTRRLPSQGRDDIAALTDSFNGMLDRLEEAFTGQTQFVLRAHRELATPLRRMDERLAAVPQTGDTVTQRTEIARMLRLLEDLRILADAERAGFIQTQERVQIDELAEQMAADLALLGRADWQVHGTGGGRLNCDPDRLRQAITQLGRNALQHGSPRDPLQLNIGPITDARGRRCIEFAVTDHGPGVVPDQVDWLFKRFTTGDGPARGAGLGLAIVRAVADAHDGTVFVDSMPGQGATFGVRIPVEAGERR